MEPPNLVKVVAAFVAGVVIALGSALIYLRVSEMVHPPPVALAQAATEPSQPAVTHLPDIGHDVAVEPAVTDVQAAPPALEHNTPRGRQAKPVRRIFARRPAVVPAPRQSQPKVALAQLARNTPPVLEPVANDVSVSETALAEPVSADIPVQAPEPAAPQPHVVTLPAGTAVAVRLSETVSTDHNYTGDTFRGTLEAEVISDGFVIADRGSKVLGRVVRSQRAGRIEGPAGLTVTLMEINTTDGQRVAIETGGVERLGPSSSRDDTAKIAGGAALGAVIGAMAGGGKGAAIGAAMGGAAGTGVALSTRGGAATLPVETKLTFRLSAPVSITEKLN